MPAGYHYHQTGIHNEHVRRPRIDIAARMANSSRRATGTHPRQNVAQTEPTDGSRTMAPEIEPATGVAGNTALDQQKSYRFHVPHLHLASVFGDDWFALKAEAFARFFGTPTFLIGQTLIVAVWIVVNMVGLTTFDIYPFILLNLAFSLQAAYAAPLILLAQTRQADRDKCNAIADATHREDLHRISEERQAEMTRHTALLLDMMQQNTQLTETIKSLTERVEVLTIEVHKHVVGPAGA
jgi:uncharacterized membrane protein